MWWPREVGWGEGREVQERGDICIIMTDLCCCMAETNTTLESNFPPIKKEAKIRLQKKKGNNQWELLFLKSKLSDFVYY